MRYTPLLLAIASTSAAGCGPIPDPLTGPCRNLSLQVVDQAVQKPANVGARLRASCDGSGLDALLTPSDFSLAEDNKVLSAFEAERVIKPAPRDTQELVLVALDLSGSVTKSGTKEEMVAGARQLVQILGADHEVAIFGFDGRADLVPFTFFTGDAMEISAAIDRVDQATTVDDSTNLNGAIIAGLDLLDAEVAHRTDGKRVAHGTLVVFTDGTDRAGRVKDYTVARRLASTAEASFAIGVGAEMNEDELKKIGKTGTAIARDLSELQDAFSSIAERVRAYAQTDYLISYCSPARAGDRSLNITVHRGALQAAVNIGFSAEGFGAGCSAEAMPVR
ncbi:MAG: VWA domain-containing protein [Myxococcota bacterium]